MEAPNLRVFKTKWFARFARRQGLEDAELCAAVARAEKGLIDADLGGGVIKQRIARPNEGRSGGFRSIVLSVPATRHSLHTGLQRAPAATFGGTN